MTNIKLINRVRNGYFYPLVIIVAWELQPWSCGVGVRCQSWVGIASGNCGFKLWEGIQDWALLADFRSGVAGGSSALEQPARLAAWSTGLE